MDVKKYKFIFYSFKEVYINGKAFFWIFTFKTLLSTIKVYVSAWLGKLLFDNILNGIIIGEITPSSLRLVVMVISVDIVFALVNLLADYYSEKSALLYNNALTLKNAKKCSRLKYQYHDNPAGKNEVKQFLNDGRSVINLYCQTVGLIFAFASFVIALAIGLRFSILVTIFSLIAAFPAFFIRKKNQNADYELEKGLNLTDRIIDYFKNVCTGKVFYKEIHLFGAISFFFDKLKGYLNLRTEKRVVLRKSKLVREFVLLFIFSIVNIVINIYVIVYIILKKLTIGDYTFYTSIINNLKNSSDSLVTSTNELIISTKKVQNYFEFYSNGDNEYKLGTKPMPSSINEIKFSNVYFMYPNTGECVLKNVSFTVSKEEKVALAGHNGAGKTTIINLLLRFYEPSSGSILLNGCDIRYYNLEEYWSFFSCMLQHSNIYDITLRENLLLGNLSKFDTIDNNALNSFLNLLGLHNISTDELDREVGKQFQENGLMFSPGQIQKLNVVRTLIANRAVVVLDEPSSSMDASTEDMIMDTIFSSSKNKMLFFISHRLSNMKKVNKIVFLEKGEVLEIGNHSELMSLKGKYSELFGKQAKNFN